MHAGKKEIYISTMLQNEFFHSQLPKGYTKTESIMPRMTYPSHSTLRLSLKSVYANQINKQYRI